MFNVYLENIEAEMFYSQSDWMQLANVTFKNNDNRESLSKNVLNYVNLVRSKYNAELTNEMPFWIENQKRNILRKKRFLES